MSRHVRVVAVLATLLTLLVAGPAATRISKGKGRKKATPSAVIYHVVYDGTGTYSYHEDSTDGSGGHAYADASFHWHADYPGLFVLRKALTMVGAPAVQARSTGGGDWTIDAASGGSGGGDTCRQSGGLALARLGGIQGAVQRSGVLALTLTPGASDFITTGGSSGTGACDTNDFWHAYPVSVSHIGSDATQEIDPLSAFIHLRPRDFSARKIVIPVSNLTLAAPSLALPEDCAAGSSQITCKQGFAWHGTVTLTKVTTSKRAH